MEALLAEKKEAILQEMSAFLNNSELLYLGDLLQELVVVAVENPIVIETPCAQIDVASVDTMGKMLASILLPVCQRIDHLLANQAKPKRVAKKVTKKTRRAAAHK